MSTLTELQTGKLSSLLIFNIGVVMGNIVVHLSINLHGLHCNGVRYPVVGGHKATKLLIDHHNNAKFSFLDLKTGLLLPLLHSTGSKNR